MRYACAAGALTTLGVGAIGPLPTNDEILALFGGSPNHTVFRTRHSTTYPT
ncbi:MAG: hypothetical protein HC795_02040 [Coleofasciculaceae cyanobacterium RL_1_1]|nr:hypothetical protein [Coleofasciculaceae cyanobacterium RL_1_1]